MEHKRTLTLRNKENEEAVTFLDLNLNDNKEVSFKSENKGIFDFSYEIILNEEKEAIEIRKKSKEGKKILLNLSDAYVNEFDRLMGFKRDILKDLSRLTNDLISGEEKIMAIEIEGGKYPYYVVSDSILNNAHYSIKYYKCLEYTVSHMAKKMKKNVVFNNFEELQFILGKAVEDAVKVNILEKVEHDNCKVVFLTLQDLISIT